MKFWITAIFLIRFSFVFAQSYTNAKFEKIIFDPYLSYQLWSNPNIHSVTSKTITIVTNENSGRTDTFQTVNNLDDINDTLTNCAIIDTGKNHYGFDRWISFFKKDTLKIQFSRISQNPDSADKLIIYILKDRFNSEYIKSPKSSYWLVVKKQNLILDNLVTKSGQGLLGNLSIQFINHNALSPVKTITLTGFFGGVLGN
jgi:hypothetical protein